MTGHQKKMLFNVPARRPLTGIESRRACAVHSRVRMTAQAERKSVAAAVVLFFRTCDVMHSKSEKF